MRLGSGPRSCRCVPDRLRPQRACPSAGSRRRRVPPRPRRTLLPPDDDRRGLEVVVVHRVGGRTWSYQKSFPVEARNRHERVCVEGCARHRRRRSGASALPLARGSGFQMPYVGRHTVRPRATACTKRRPRRPRDEGHGSRMVLKRLKNATFPLALIERVERPPSTWSEPDRRDAYGPVVRRAARCPRLVLHLRDEASPPRYTVRPLRRSSANTLRSLCRRSEPGGGCESVRTVVRSLASSAPSELSRCARQERRLDQSSVLGVHGVPRRSAGSGRSKRS